MGQESLMPQKWLTQGEADLLTCGPKWVLKFYRRAGGGADRMDHLIGEKHSCYSTKYLIECQLKINKLRYNKLSVNEARGI